MSIGYSRIYRVTQTTIYGKLLPSRTITKNNKKSEHYVKKKNLPIFFE